MKSLLTFAAWTRRHAGWLVLVAALAAVIVLQRPDDIEPDATLRMAGMAFSRANIEDVRMFKDRSVMHGLKFFYFKASDADTTRFLRWLDVKPQAAVPEWIASRIEVAKKHVDWPFDWATPKVYAIQYCPGRTSEAVYDVVLVDGGRVVYMTTGYGETPAVATEDFASCKPAS